MTCSAPIAFVLVNRRHFSHVIHNLQIVYKLELSSPLDLPNVHIKGLTPNLPRGEFASSTPRA